MLDFALINKAYLFAQKAHENKFRADNKTPYIRHIIEVVRQLEDFSLEDNEIFLTAILHDVLEKTDINEEQLLNEFGYTITNNVKQLSYNKDKMTEKEYYLLNKNSVVKLADHITNTLFFIKTKIRDPQKYYDKGIVIIDNFKKTKPFKNYIDNLESILMKGY